jgi:hypothetical protein
MRDKRALVLFALQALCIASLVVPSNLTEGPLVFEHVNVVRVQDGSIARNVTLTIAEGRVSNAGGAARYARRIDAHGAYVIPGLWDMHVHVNEDASWMLPLAAAMGIVGMRDMGGSLEDLPKLRRLAAEPGMPQVLASGPILTGQVDDADERVWRLATPADVWSALERLSAAHVDHVKVHDWLTPATWRRIIREARTRHIPVVGHLPVQVDASEAAGRQKSIEHMGNAWGGLLLDVSSREAALKRAVKSRMLVSKDPQQLGEFFTPARWLDIAHSFAASKADALARAFARHGTFVCPTLYTFAWLPSRDVGAPEKADPRLAYLPLERRAMLESMASMAPPDPLAVRSRLAVFRVRQQLVRAFQAGGVTLLAGTDYAQYPLVFPGFTLHDELAQLVDAGLSPLDALRTATVNVGRYVQSSAVGCLDVGCRADAVFLASNPLDDIRHVTGVRAVLVGGRYLDEAARQARLDRLRAAASRRSVEAFDANINPHSAR